MYVDREGFGFGHEISAIEGARNEMYTKKILTHTTTDPVKTHVNTLRHFGGIFRPIRVTNSCWRLGTIF